MLTWTQLLRQWDQGLKRNSKEIILGCMRIWFSWTCVEKTNISSKAFYDTKRVRYLTGKVQGNWVSTGLDTSRSTRLDIVNHVV